MQRPDLKWISFNCHEGRPGEVRAGAVGAILDKHKPHVAKLQETRRAIPQITDEARRRGYKVVLWDICGTALLVQADLPVKGVSRVLLGTESWTFRGNEHERRAVCEAIVLGYRVGAVHAVPNPHGSRERDLQYNIGIDRAEAHFDAHPRFPLQWTGDWNKTAQGEPGRYTPEALAGRTGGTAYVGTHQVCFPINRKCTVIDLDLLDEGNSDHPLLVGMTRRD